MSWKDSFVKPTAEELKRREEAAKAKALTELAEKNSVKETITDATKFPKTEKIESEPSVFGNIFGRSYLGFE